MASMHAFKAACNRKTEDVMNATKKIACLVTAAAALGTAPAFADNWHGRGHGWGHERTEHRGYERHFDYRPYRVYEHRPVVIERPVVIQRSYVTPPVVYSPPVLYSAPMPSMGPAAMIGAAIGTVIDERY